MVELRIGIDIRRKGKVEKATEFAEKIRKILKEAGVVLRKAQEEMKRQVNRRQGKVEEWKKGERVILSAKYLVFKKRPVKKLTEQYMGPYIVEEVVSKNAVKLKLPASMRIYLMVNISRVVRYRELVKRQRVEEQKLVEVDRVEE